MINFPESFGAFLKDTFYNVDNSIPSRMSDNICHNNCHNNCHNICHKISSHVTSGNDVIGNVTIAKLGCFVAVTRFHYRVKNKGFSCVELLKVTR